MTEGIKLMFKNIAKKNNAKIKKFWAKNKISFLVIFIKK
jgi:hypothetical protein